MRVFLDSVGCRLNQAEIETLARQFRLAGHEIVASAETADLAVVNTCTVTGGAASDSRGAIRRLARHGSPAVVATGCWATLQPSQAADLPNVAQVVPNALKEQLVGRVLGSPVQERGAVPLARQPLPGLRRRTRAFIKVQDGCDNQCTFCITTAARGPSRSRSIDEVVADVCAAVRGGTREIVLTGVHLGAWGREWRLHLRALIGALLQDTDVPRLRLSSLEPWDLDARFLGMWSDARLCPHFHLPLQSGCAATLRRMRRRTSPGAFRALVAQLRSVVPDAAVTTDIIAGFPGETRDEFCASLEFVREMQFAGGHAFTYSPMAGTPAARMRNQIGHAERLRRTHSFRQVFEDHARSFRTRFLGQARPVLWESAVSQPSGAWLLSGLTDNYIRVQVRETEPRRNKIDAVELRREAPGGLLGTIRKRG